MVWKSTTKVSFGILGRYVVAYYCNTIGNAPIKAGETISAYGTRRVTEFKTNVGTGCWVFDSTVPAKVYNKCYTKRARTEHNAKRGLHEARDLDEDITIS